MTDLNRTSDYLSPVPHPHGSVTRPPQASTSTAVVQSSGLEEAPVRHPRHLGGHPMVEHVQVSTSSTLPTMVPQSLLISANPVATLRIFAEAERARSHKKIFNQNPSWANAWTRLPTAPSAASLSKPATPATNHARNRKRPRLPLSGSKTNFTQTMTQGPTLSFTRSLKRIRMERFSNRSNDPPPSDRSPTPSTSSASSIGSSADTIDLDAYHPYADEDDDESDEYLVPAHACLPPTPLTPQDILQSSTLSRLFSRNNRTFHQIANSATGLVEADLNTCNRMSELVEVLRGDLGGRRWVEVVERAFLAPLSGERSANAMGQTGKGRTLPKVDPHQYDGYANASPNARSQRPSMNGRSGATNTSSNLTSGRLSLPNGNPGHRRIQALEQSDFHSQVQSPSRGPSDETPPVGPSASDSLTEGHQSMLDPRYQILTQAPGFIQSLFVSSDPVTVPVLRRPLNDGRGFHAHQHNSSTEFNTSQKINGISSTSKNYSGLLNLGATETLSIQQQIESYNECAIELSKFLGDLTDYRDRLLEIRDGCLTVEKRRLAMWAVVKLSANGYDEICHGQDPSLTSEPSSAMGEFAKVEPNGANLSSSATVAARTGSPCQRGKSKPR